MAYFDLPTGYSCITRNSDTQLYAYTNNKRDTFTLNGFSWQKTATQNNTTIPTTVVCVSGQQIPSNFTQALVFPSVLVVLAFFYVIFNMFLRLKR